MELSPLPPAELLLQRRTAALEYLALFIAYARVHGLTAAQAAEWGFRQHVRAGTYAELVQRRGAGNVAAAVDSHLRVRQVYCARVSVALRAGEAVVDGSPVLDGLEPMLAILAVSPEDFHSYLAVSFRLVGQALGLKAEWEQAPNRERLIIAGRPETMPSDDRGEAGLLDRAAAARYYVGGNLTRTIGLARDRGMPAEDVGRFLGHQRDRAGAWTDLLPHLRQNPAAMGQWLGRRRFSFVDRVSLDTARTVCTIDCNSFVADIPRTLAVYGVGAADFGRYFNGAGEGAGERLGLRLDYEVGQRVFRTVIHRR